MIRAIGGVARSTAGKAAAAVAGCLSSGRGTSALALTPPFSFRIVLARVSSSAAGPCSGEDVRRGCTADTRSAATPAVPTSHGAVLTQTRRCADPEMSLRFARLPRATGTHWFQLAGSRVKWDLSCTAAKGTLLRRNDCQPLAKVSSGK